MKWAYSLKGRTLKKTMSDALSEMTGLRFHSEEIWRNTGIMIANYGICSWGTYEHIYKLRGDNFHSWDSIKDCLKYGFEITDKNEIVAKDKDIFNKR